MHFAIVANAPHSAIDFQMVTEGSRKLINC